MHALPLGSQLPSTRMAKNDRLCTKRQKAQCPLNLSWGTTKPKHQSLPRQSLRIRCSSSGPNPLQACLRCFHDQGPLRSQTQAVGVRPRTRRTERPLKRLRLRLLQYGHSSLLNSFKRLVQRLPYLSTTISTLTERRLCTRPSSIHHPSRGISMIIARPWREKRTRSPDNTRNSLNPGEAILMLQIILRERRVDSIRGRPPLSQKKIHLWPHLQDQTTTFLQPHLPNRSEGLVLWRP